MPPKFFEVSKSYNNSIWINIEKINYVDEETNTVYLDHAVITIDDTEFMDALRHFLRYSKQW